MRKYIFNICLTLLIWQNGAGQSLLKDSVMNASIIQFNYSFQWPGGDLADRFGAGSKIGAGLTFKMNHNWLLGTEAHFLFSGNVKERDILRHITTQNEDALISTDGYLSQYVLYERGFMIMGEMGKIIPVIGPNPNCGIMIMAGAGFMQHKIRIQVQTDNVPQMNKEYKKGYDRLTNGVALSQFMGYFHLDTRKLLNFYIGVDVEEAFTQNRRDWNYDTNSQDNKHRKDLLYGVKAGWMIPIYKKSTQRFYYY